MNKRRSKILLIALIIFTLLFMLQSYFLAPQTYMQEALPAVESMMIQLDSAGINQQRWRWVAVEKGDPLFDELHCFISSGMYVGTLFNRGDGIVNVMGQPGTVELTDMGYRITAMTEEGSLFAYSLLRDGREGIESLYTEERWSPVHHFEVGNGWRNRFERMEEILDAYDLDWQEEYRGVGNYDDYMNEEKADR